MIDKEKTWNVSFIRSSDKSCGSIIVRAVDREGVIKGFNKTIAEHEENSVAIKSIQEVQKVVKS